MVRAAIAHLVTATDLREMATDLREMATALHETVTVLHETVMLKVAAIDLGDQRPKNKVGS